MRENSPEVQLPRGAGEGGGLWPCGLRVHGSSTAASHSAQGPHSLPGSPHAVPQNGHPLCFLSCSLPAFLLATLSSGLSLWILKGLFWKSRKNEHSFFLSSSSFNPNSAQDNVDKCIWLGNEDVWEREERTRINFLRKTEICCFLQLLYSVMLFGGESAL